MSGVDMDLMKRCVVLLLLQHTGEALKISAPTTFVATKGSENLIPCEYTVQNPPVNPEFLAAIWYFQGKKVLTFDNEVTTTDPRYSLDTEKALLGRVDLSISDISISDAGVYTCSVIYSPSMKKKDITVDIKAPPQLTITNKTAVLNAESVLRCSASGFFPPDIDITWYRGSKMMTNVTVDPPQKNLDRTYSVNSTVTITPTEDDRAQIFSCRVQHQHLQEPLREDFQLTFTDKTVTAGDESPVANTSNVVLIAAVVITLVVVVIMVIILIVLCICKRNRTSQQSNTENTKERTSEDRPDPGGDANAPSWQTAASHTSWTREPQVGDSCCKVKDSQETVEVNTDELHMTVPLQVAVTEKTVVVNAKSVLLCYITGFYPAEIDVKWFRGSERLSNNTMTPPLRNQKGLYSVKSTVTIVPTEEDRDRIFSCIVQHVSLQQPVREDFQLIFTERTPLLNIDKNRKSPRNPDKNTSQNIHDQRCIVTADKERNQPNLKKQDKADLMSYNASIQEKGKTKIAPQFQKKSAEQKTKQLRESYVHKNTPRLKNGNSQELYPGNELPREEDREGGPLEDSEGGPLEDSEGVVLEDSEAGPLEDSKAGPLEDSEGGPLKDSEGGSLKDSEGGPLKDSEGEPLEDSEGEPLKDSEGGPLENNEAGPLENREAGPLEDSEGGPLEDSEGVLLEDSEAGPLEDSEAGPLEDNEGGPLEDSEGVLLEESEAGQLEDSEAGPLEDSKGGPLEDSQRGPSEDCEGGHQENSEGGPPEDSEGRPPEDNGGRPDDSEGEPPEDSDSEETSLLKKSVNCNERGRKDKE